MEIGDNVVADDVEDTLRTLMGENEFAEVKQVDPDDPDLQMLDAICDYHDSIPFAETFQTDVAVVGAVANLRSQKMLDQVWDEYEIGEEKETLRNCMKESLVLMWLDAFAAGQRYQQRATGQPEGSLYKAPPEERAFYDGNRRQRRRRKRK
jgi:hypothetical protein